MSGSHPTSKRRKQKQLLKARYAKVREEAQLADIIPTTPEGAVRNEVVCGNAILPDIVRQALRENWATPDVAKPAIVANLLEPFFMEREIDPNTGKPIPPNRAQLLECAKVLRMLDQTQHERDNPNEAGNGNITISLQNTLQATATMRESLTDVDRVMDLTRQCFVETEVDVHRKQDRE